VALLHQQARVAVDNSGSRAGDNRIRASFLCKWATQSIAGGAMLDVPPACAVRCGPATGGEGHMITIDHTGLHGLFARFARTLTAGYDLEDVIVQLGEDICTILDVSGAGIMVEDDDGKLRFMSTSDETLRTLEQLQIELDEGPCLQAYRTGKQVIAADLRDDPRFRRFGPLAITAGMQAVYSFPMMIQGDMPIGAFNLYRSSPGPLTDEQALIGQVFAEVASAFIVHARDDDHRTLLNRQLQTALDSRVLIEQAKGYVRAMCGVSVSTAFEALRRYARNHSMRLAQVANQVLEEELPVDKLPFDD
jgi:GAF domain-containing protein